MMLQFLKDRNINREDWADLITTILRFIVPNAKAQILVPRDHKRQLNFRVFDHKGGTVCWFSMSFMPGCKGVLILHRMEVTESWRNKGISRAMWQVKLHVAHQLQAGMLMCTVTHDNAVQNHLLQSTPGWHWDTSFPNPQTKHKVYVYTYKL